MRACRAASGRPQQPSGSRSGLQDDTTAKAFIPGIEDRVLPRRCCALGNWKLQLQDAFPGAPGQFAGDHHLPVSQPDVELRPARCLEGTRLTVDPVQFTYAQSTAQQGRMIVALHHDQRIPLLVAGGNKPGGLFPVCLPTDIQPVTLAEGVIGET